MVLHADLASLINEKMSSLITEAASQYDDLDKMSVGDLLTAINFEDAKVALAVKHQIPNIQRFVELLVPKFESGGRLFYIGAGTSGRLGILDASEIPPTYGLPHERVIGLIAGGDQAIRKAVEFAEDSKELAAKDLESYQLNRNDTVVGIAASGTTPYVIGGLAYAKSLNCLTGCITNNTGSPISELSDVKIEVVVGPEFVTGSTRMKSGTAQKLVLNMISTTLMIKVGRVKGNKMVNMQLTNEKLVKRGIRFLMEELELSEEEAEKSLEKFGSVNEAILHHKK